MYYVQKGDYESFNMLTRRSAKCLNFAKLFFQCVIHNQKLPESRLHSILFQLTNVTELNLDFYGKMEIVPEEFDKKVMRFPNLEKFKINVYYLKYFYMILHFMKFIEVPRLKKLECGGSQTYLPICENFFRMATRSLDTLEELKFWFGGGHNFQWSKGSRFVNRQYCEEIMHEITDFLRPLAKDLIKVVSASREIELQSFLLTQCVNMEFISSDLDFRDLSENFYVPKCNRVEPKFTEWTQPEIYKLH
jgi:hypothetical protein